MRYLSAALASLCLMGCGAISGEKVRITRTEIGLRDPIYVISKEIYPHTGKPVGFGFPLQVFLNAKLYRSISFDYEGHILRDSTTRTDYRCRLDTNDIVPTAVPKKDPSKGHDPSADSKQGKLVLHSVPTPDQADATETAPGPGDSPPDRKWMIKLWCPDLNAEPGHDFSLKLKVTHVGSLDAADAKDKTEMVSIPLVVSYNGWLLSLGGGLFLTFIFVIVGYKLSDP